MPEGSGLGSGDANSESRGQHLPWFRIFASGRLGIERSHGAASRTAEGQRIAIRLDDHVWRTGSKTAGRARKSSVAAGLIPGPPFFMSGDYAGLPCRPGAFRSPPGRTRLPTARLMRPKRFCATRNIYYHAARFRVLPSRGSRKNARPPRRAPSVSKKKWSAREPWVVRDHSLLARFGTPTKPFDVGIVVVFSTQRRASRP